MQLLVQLHDHPENFFARGSQVTWALGSHEAWRKAWFLLCWRRPTQLAAADRLQAPSCSRCCSQTFLQGFALRSVFQFLNMSGRGSCFSISELSEPLAQRQDASFRQRRLDLVLLAHQGRKRLPSHQLMKPCSRVIVSNHPDHSAQQGSLVSAPTDGVKTPRKPQVLSDLSTACKPPPFLSVMVHSLLPTDGGD